MTVAELIDELHEMPGDVQAYVGKGTGPVEGIRLAAMMAEFFVVIEP